MRWSREKEVLEKMRLSERSASTVVWVSSLFLNEDLLCTAQEPPASRMPDRIIVEHMGSLEVLRWVKSSNAEKTAQLAAREEGARQGDVT